MSPFQSADKVPPLGRLARTRALLLPDAVTPTDSTLRSVMGNTKSVGSVWSAKVKLMSCMSRCPTCSCRGGVGRLSATSDGSGSSVFSDWPAPSECLANRRLSVLVLSAKSSYFDVSPFSTILLMSNRRWLSTILPRSTFSSLSDNTGALLLSTTATSPRLTLAAMAVSIKWATLPSAVASRARPPSMVSI